MEDNFAISTLKSEGFNEPLKVKKGITDAQIDQLIEYSKSDESLKKFTGDPKRFATRKGFDEFSTHIMAYYVLTDDGDNLMGLIWFDDFTLPTSVISNDLSERSQDSKDKPGDSSSMTRNDKNIETDHYGISFAIRIYGPARGKGLSIPFTKKVLENFQTTNDYRQKTNHDIWLAVSPDNYPAISTYEKSGFKKIGRWEEKNKLLMIL